MWRELINFYKECLVRAFRGRFWQVEKWTGGLSILALIISYAVHSSPKTERLIETAVPMYFFVGMFGATVLAGLLRAPVDLYREQREARLSLEELRKPKLHIMLPRGGVASVDLTGNTSESYGGPRTTTVTGWSSSVIYVLVSNLGESAALGCRARVLWASREAPDGKVEAGGIIEAIELPWSKKDPENNLSTSIAPGDTGRFWIANVRQGGNLWVFRDISELPINYHRVFGDEGIHTLLIQVDSESVAPTQILLRVRTEKATKPVGNGVWEPSATAEILSQGSPPLDHPAMPQRVEPI